MSPAPPDATAVYLERGKRWVFACALDWPGWCRRGRSEELALEQLAAKGWPARYAARRIAWHVLDHAWEIEDRSEGADATGGR